jgi:hypothetical protein
MRSRDVEIEDGMLLVFLLGVVRLLMTASSELYRLHVLLFYTVSTSTVQYIGR